MVSMVTDHRVPKKYVGRLVLQEYDPVQKKMTGPVKDIYRADKIFLEGPHIFQAKRMVLSVLGGYRHGRTARADHTEIPGYLGTL